MADNEIIKILENKADIDCDMCCDNNENCDGDYCEKIISQSALNLINRQKARIEELEKGELSKAMTFNSDTIKRCSAEAIREFAERLKMAFYYEFEELIPSIMADKIDEIVKEMTEGENG